MDIQSLDYKGVEELLINTAVQDPEACNRFVMDFYHEDLDADKLEEYGDLYDKISECKYLVDSDNNDLYIKPSYIYADGNFCEIDARDFREAMENYLDRSLKLDTDLSDEVDIKLDDGAIDNMGLCFAYCQADYDGDSYEIDNDDNSCGIDYDDVSYGIDSGTCAIRSSGLIAQDYDFSPKKSIGVRNVTYKKALAIFERFVDNCKIIKKAETKKESELTESFKRKLTLARMEVEYVAKALFASKNLETNLAMIIHQSNKTLRESFDKYMNIKKLARESKLVVSVERVAKGEKISYNNGHYRVYVSDGVKKEQISFIRKQSIVVYIIYLLDRYKNGDQVDTLQIEKYEEVFCGIFSKIYRGRNPQEIFDKLTSKVLKGEARPTQFKDCLNDIRKSFEKVIKPKFNEEVLPFIIPDDNLHIAILASNIDVSKVPEFEGLFSEFSSKKLGFMI